MNLVSLHQVSHHYGINLLLDGVTLHITEETKLGLIGVNGTGKTTLLRVIGGDVKPESGEVQRHPEAVSSMVYQDSNISPDTTVLEAALQGGDRACRLLLAYEQALDRLQKKPEQPELQKQLLSLQQQMDALNAWDLETQAKTVLTKLGFHEVHAPTNTLSGGQRRRISLAGALIRPANLLILDEPTNHLDLNMIQWLEQYLKNWKGALVMVTHDRYFLDRVIRSIGELENGKFTRYSGSYQQYLQEKDQLLAKEASAERRLQTLYRQEPAWIRRGARARTTKQKARIERFESLEGTLEKRPESELELPVLTHRLGKKVVQLKGVSFSYQQKPIIQSLDLLLKPGEIIGLAGPNGSGKSTLLKLIAGELAPDSGTIERGETVRLSFFQQENQELNPEQRVLEYIRESREVVTLGKNQRITASQMLERFLFSPDKQWTKVGTLSGGEKRRLMLLRRLMEEPNLLLLDEPTNDLDVITLAVLEEYLEQFSGTVLIASHDRYLMDRLADRLLVFKGSGVVRETGLSCSQWLAQEEAGKESDTDEMTRAGKQGRDAPRETYPSGKDLPKRSAAGRPVKFSYKEQRLYETIEDTIGDVEDQIRQLEEEMDVRGSDFGFLEEAAKDKERLNKELDQLLQQWEELSEKAEMIRRHNEFTS